jgi:hypothetical protein
LSSKTTATSRGNQPQNWPSIEAQNAYWAERDLRTMTETDRLIVAMQERDRALLAVLKELQGVMEHMNANIRLLCQRL